MIGLEPFLSALRESGLPVGVAEVARLHEVFALEPRLADGPSSSPRLRAVLRAVCVKSVEDRDLFDRIFDAWLSRSDQEVSLLAMSRAERKDREERTAARRPRRFLWRILAPGLLFPLCLALGGLLKTPHELSAPKAYQPAPRPSLTASTQARPAGSPDEIRKRSFTSWVPTLSVDSKPAWRGWAPLALNVLALLAAGALWLNQRGRRWFPPPAPAPVKKGPSRVFLSPLRLAGPQLMAPWEQETLVWGIGHFIADEPTRRLDLPATVRATARSGGVPHLRFHRARYPREVWLWVDEAADDPAIQRLVGEAEAALLTYGLPVERALFRGIPDWLVNSSGESFALNEVDERRDAALVAILTDGRLLARHYAADDRRLRLDALLRSLSHWPRLAFVDFSLGPDDLAGILAKHSIERIEPAGMAAFLGSDESASRSMMAPAVAGDAMWAAACALAPASVDEARAFEIRRSLGLAVSPWTLNTLRVEAPGPFGRLQWRPQDRARLVNWMRAAEEQPDGGIAPGSLLGQALAFWEESYDRELKGWGAGEAGVWWQGTPAHQHLAMERALLGLWRDAPRAVRELYQLYGGVLHDTIKQQLGDLAPLDHGGEEHVHLPWQWSERSGTERVMLQKMGFGGGMPVATVRRPGRLWIGLGLCLGLAAGALGVAVFGGTEALSGPPKVEVENRPPGTATWLSQTASGGWRVIAESSTWLIHRSAPAGAVVRERWAQTDRPCVEEPAAGVEIWHCGAGPVREASLFSPDIRQSLVILEDPEKDPAVETLAVALLDSGSADIVYVVRASFFDWWKRLPPLLSLQQDQQMLVLTPSRLSRSVRKGERIAWLRAASWKGLEAALRFDGRKSVREVWPQLAALEGDPARLWLHGLGTCRTGETLTVAGMEFVHVCPGTFTMGSNAGDPRAYSDELPAHEVTLSEYWIGQYEVTQAQYESKGSDNRPATRVSWVEADGFCRKNGWRLPTEAEWEYAARAGTQTAWSFGDDEKKLRDYAWFDGNSGLETHPVGTRYPNPWGIFDMHGNALEWVADRYGPYDIGAQTDPTGPSAGQGRVLRGGALDVPARDLRSAARFRNLPSGRFTFLGFRCARGPSPPPPLPPLSHPAGRGAPPPNK